MTVPFHEHLDQPPTGPRDDGHDARYDYARCEACGQRAQNIDTGRMPSGERVCGFCLRLSIGLTFAQLRELRRDARFIEHGPGLGYVHGLPVQHDHLGRTLPCGIYIARELYDSRRCPRTVTTRIGDRVTCPACLEAEQRDEATLCPCGRVSQRADEPCNACANGDES